MKRTNRILSLVICIAILFTTVSVISVSANTGVLLSNDGSTTISVANNEDDVNVKQTANIGGIGGKDAQDASIYYEVADGVTLKNGGGCFLGTSWSWARGNRVLMGMDIMFTDLDAKLTFEYQSYNANEGTDISWSNYFVHISPAEGISRHEGIEANQSPLTVPDEAPTSLSVNEWHNIAVEVANDGTKSVIVYVDGVAYNCTSAFDMYGMHRFRANIISGSFYLDNYYCRDEAAGTDMYDESIYAVGDITVSESEKVSYNTDTKLFSLSDTTLTAGELKELIDSGENTKTVYSDPTYQTVMADTDTVTMGSVVVVSNGNGAYRYYGFERINDTDYEYTTDGISATVTGFKADCIPEANASITIPDTIAGYSVTAIGDNAFRVATGYNGVTLNSVTLPDTIKSIGNYAFAATSLNSLNWPTSLETIGSNAFANALYISAKLPPALKSIGSNAFAYSRIGNGGAVTLPEGLETIGQNAFLSCGYITTLIIPDSVTTIGKDAVGMGASRLTKFRFPRNNSYTEITASNNPLTGSYNASKNAYLYNSMSIYIPDTVTSIYDEFLKDFKDGATVTIYAAKDSAAYEYYLKIKDLLAEGNYCNSATFGSEGAYTDKDADGKGELAAINFVEYDFEFDTEVKIDNTNIKTGEEAVSILAPTVDEYTSVMEANISGVGGKSADDVVMKLTTKGGSSGQNYLNGSGSNAAFVYELSLMIPSTGRISANLDWYYDSAKTLRHNTTAFSIDANSISVFGQTVAEAEAGRWYNIAIYVANDGTGKASAMINGVKYDTVLKSNSYGVRHFRVYPEAKDTSYTAYGEYSVYFDNLRTYLYTTRGYNRFADKQAQVSAGSDDIQILNEDIIYTNPEAEYTASQLISKLSVNESAKENIRVYTDSSYTTQVGDDETVPDNAAVVVAATNGYDMERVYSYYQVTKERIIYKYEVISEEEKTAKVTGFLEENIIATDDLSSIAIPSEIKGYKIVSIGANAFQNETRIQNVVIPDSVETIGNYAFAGSVISDTGVTCGTITSVKLSQNLKSIGQHAFEYHPGLEEIDLPDGLESIGSRAFYWSGIKRLTVPNSVTYMGEGTTALCASLEYLMLPSGITSIPANTFYHTIAMKEVVIPASIESANSSFTNMDLASKDWTVYGVSGTFAQEFANEYGFEFVDVIANTLVASQGIYGDGEKLLAGTDYDLNSGFEKLVYKADLVNVGETDTEVTVILAMYDKNDKMVEISSLDILIPAGKVKKITDEDNISISAGKLADGYTVKAFVWRSRNNEPLSIPCEVVMNASKQEIHVLAIGNSFCNDSFTYIKSIAEADGVIMKTQNMYIGGATLSQHYKNMSENLSLYQPVINNTYASGIVTMQEGLESDRWSVVALQAGTHGYSSDYDFIDYDAEGSNTENIYTFIKDYVTTYAPSAKKVMHMSWAPCEEASRAMYNGRFADETAYPSASGAMFEAQKAAYEYAASIYSDEASMMVPTSIAVWYAINELGMLEHSGEMDSTGKFPNPVAGEISLFRDETCHLTTPYGRVLAGLCWYEYLTGNDVTENPYQHSGISEDVMAQLKEAAHYACSQVTPVTGSVN